MGFLQNFLVKPTSLLITKLSLLNEDRTLSITNLIMYIVCWKLLRADVLDWPTLSTMFLACANYNVKRHYKHKVVKASDTVKEDIETLKQKVSNLNMSKLTR